MFECAHAVMMFPLLRLTVPRKYVWALHLVAKRRSHSTQCTGVNFPLSTKLVTSKPSFEAALSQGSELLTYVTMTMTNLTQSVIVED